MKTIPLKDKEKERKIGRTINAKGKLKRVKRNSSQVKWAFAWHHRLPSSFVLRWYFPEAFHLCFGLWKVFCFIFWINSDLSIRLLWHYNDPSSQFMNGYFINSSIYFEGWIITKIVSAAKTNQLAIKVEESCWNWYLSNLFQFWYFILTSIRYKCFVNIPLFPTHLNVSTTGI